MGGREKRKEAVRGVNMRCGALRGGAEPGGRDEYMWEEEGRKKGRREGEGGIRRSEFTVTERGKRGGGGGGGGANHEGKRVLVGPGIFCRVDQNREVKWTRVIKCVILPLGFSHKYMCWRRRTE